MRDALILINVSGMSASLIKSEHPMLSWPYDDDDDDDDENEEEEYGF